MKKEKKIFKVNKIDINEISSFLSNKEKLREILKKEYQNEEILKEKRNFSLCLFLIGLILLIIGIIFIPMSIITTIRDQYFAYLSLEAFFVYLGIGIGSILLVIGVVLFIIYLSNKRINKNNIHLLLDRLDNIK